MFLARLLVFVKKNPRSGYKNVRLRQPIQYRYSNDKSKENKFETE